MSGSKSKSLTLTRSIRPTAFSIMRICLASSLVMNVKASPVRWARPVRPIRCVYASAVEGMSKLYTCVTRVMSIPRAAMSVATMMW